MSPSDITGSFEQNGSASSAPINKNKRSGKFYARLLVLILILAVVFLGYGYYKNKKELDTIKDPAAQAEVARKLTLETVEQVRKIALIPTDGELPEMLTINNPELAVREQPNLVGVIAGDKILLYIKSGKAIVYSPSRNIIVNILPVTMQQPVEGQNTSVQNSNSAVDSVSTDTATSSSR